MSSAVHILTHTLYGVSHTFVAENKGSELRFYLLSTAFLCGYYYYLYIYKSRFQADQFLPRVHLLNTYTSARATA
jgi:hypothetical protein